MDDRLEVGNTHHLLSANSVEGIDTSYPNQYFFFCFLSLHRSHMLLRHEEVQAIEDLARNRVK